MYLSKAAVASKAALVFPELAPVEQSKPKALTTAVREKFSVRDPQSLLEIRRGTPSASTLSFMNMHEYGDLLVNFMRARKRTFIEQLGWDLPQADGMEFDQYDTPFCRWVVIHDYGEVLGGVRLTPSTAKCGMYSYMLRDAQSGLLEPIPRDVLFFRAPVDPQIWEASRLFIVREVPAPRRTSVQTLIMNRMTEAARELGGTHVIGIVPAVWSRWLRRLDLDAIPVGPRFAIDGTISQAALFKTSRYVN